MPQQALEKGGCRIAGAGICTLPVPRASALGESCLSTPGHSLRTLPSTLSLFGQLRAANVPTAVQLGCSTRPLRVNQASALTTYIYVPHRAPQDGSPGRSPGLSPGPPHLQRFDQCSMQQRVFGLS